MSLRPQFPFPDFCEINPSPSPSLPLPVRPNIAFERTGPENGAGGVPGRLTIGDLSWPTIERGGGYTFVRKGNYTLTMDMKNTGRHVQCLRFDHEGIRTHLIHDALRDSHLYLEGCIAPGLTATKDGITGSEKAMKEVFQALGGYFKGVKVTIRVANNITGDETGQDWIERRKRAGKW